VSRVVLWHWNAAEGEERAARLRGAGYRVELFWKGEPAELRAMGVNPPDAFVIDLALKPSGGRRAR